MENFTWETLLVELKDIIEDSDKDSRYYFIPAALLAIMLEMDERNRELEKLRDLVTDQRRQIANLEDRIRPLECLR